MKLKYQFYVHQVADSYAAVTIGKDARVFKGMICTNETGAYLLSQLKDDITEEELLRRMMLKYDEEKSVLRDALREFTAKLFDDDVLIP